MIQNSYNMMRMPMFGHPCCCCGGFAPMPSIFNFGMPNMFNNFMFGNMFGYMFGNMLANNIFAYSQPRFFMPPMNFTNTPVFTPTQVNNPFLGVTRPQITLPTPTVTTPTVTTDTPVDNTKKTEKTKTPAKAKTKKSKPAKTPKELPTLANSGYDSKKGAKLADEISKIQTGFDGYCAKHVKKAIESAGLGRYQLGHAYQMANILSKNKNFREISTENLDLSKLPAGCVLVYGKGVAGYSSKYGHTEITLGNGTAGSGGITHNIRSGARVFVPV